MKNKINDPDFQLIQQVKNGNTFVYRQLVDNYKDIANSLAYSIVRNQSDAEDCVQEAFIKAYNGLQRFRFQCTFSTWLYTIVVNNCKTRLRKRKYSQAYISEQEQLVDKNSDLHTGYEALINKERSFFVKKTLDSLATDYALLLRLYYLGEKNIKEIKSITGFTEAKIKVNLFRARKKFQEAFQKISGEKAPWIN